MFAYMTNATSAHDGACGTQCRDDRLVYDVPDVARILGISIRSVNVLIKSGRIKSYKVLSLRKIDRAAVETYLQTVVAPEYTASEAS